MRPQRLKRVKADRSAPAVYAKTVKSLARYCQRISRSEIAKQICDAIPAGDLAIIPKAGHVSNMEQPEEFNERVRRFCLEGGAA